MIDRAMTPFNPPIRSLAKALGAQTHPRYVHF
jgi:hypothetical protein